MKDYSINEKVTNGERNIRRAKCFIDGCNCTLEKGEGYRVFIPSRGVRVVCYNHYSNNGMIRYHENANNGVQTVGTTKKGRIESTEIGVEIECKNNMEKSAFTTLRALVENCCVCRMESDCTVSGELPTSKMEGLGKISKLLQSMEKHHLMCFVNNEECGAHIHVNCNDVAYIRRYYHSIFLPLATYIYNMDASRRIELFGSDFRYYAKMINECSNALEHSNIFNVQHEHTIEFRLPRITGYKQYMRLLKFWRECGSFINHFDFNKNNPDNMVRKVKARECGEALLNIAINHFE